MKMRVSADAAVVDSSNAIPKIDLMVGLANNDQLELAVKRKRSIRHDLKNQRPRSWKSAFVVSADIRAKSHELGAD
jgi:hypothetical protein